MQSRIFEIESLSAPEPSEVEGSRNRHLRFATDLKAWPRPESFSGLRCSLDFARIDRSNAWQICQFFLTFNTQT
jgi:hypothetical protein